MTENNLSRRKMIAVTGATVAATAALAGCGGEMKGGKVMGEDDTPKDLGIPDLYGLDANIANLPGQKPPETHKPEKFKPKYITLIRISSQKAWSLDINYASFEVDGNLLPAEREKLAVELLTQTKDGAKPRKRFKDVKWNAQKHPKIFNRAKPDEPKILDMSDFKDLGASQQEETYIWLDSATVEVSDKLLISFVPKTDKYEHAEKNDTFFARAVSGDGLPGKLIAIENYFMKGIPDTTDPDKTNYRPRTADEKASLYAMNIHFTIPGATGAADRIPIAIDPTKGNGGGYLP